MVAKKSLSPAVHELGNHLYRPVIISNKYLLQWRLLLRRRSISFWFSAYLCRNFATIAYLKHARVILILDYCVAKVIEKSLMCGK
jgi:hypothetical protein